jgi:osmoprotectant transport system permease protein
MRLIQFWSSHLSELATLTGQHVLLVVVSTAIAVALGLPLGVLAARRPRLGAPLVALANIVQTIPSLAMFGFLIPIPLVGGVGARAAIVALILYGLLPVIRTTAAGLNGIDPALLEVGVAMGMTPRQRFTLVELPLALPSIVSGIRVATVVGVGTATIAAAIGAGGLGEYIFRGLSMVDSSVILAGAVPAAALALAADGLLTWVERSLSPRRRRAAKRRAALAAGMAVVAAQILLGEIVAQALERQGVPVERRLNLGGTLICDRAVRSGALGLYVEYTGTALTAIFHRSVAHDREAVLDEVREEYARTGRTVEPPLGFNNTFAILVRGDDARQYGLRSIGDLARVQDRWQAGFGYEFLERPDGYRGLVKAYDLHFGRPPRVMDLAVMYRALADHQVDVVAGDATSGLIEALGLVSLADDRRYFPPYDAIPVVETRTLLQWPAIRPALQRLAGRLPDQAMRRLNYEVDVRHRDTAAVAREFLEQVAGR